MQENNNAPVDVKICVLIAENLESDFHSNSILTDFNSEPALLSTLGWLSDNNIKECFVLCGASRPAVQKVLQSNPSLKNTLNCKITVVGVDNQCKSVGDFLREVHFRQLVTKDFLLVFGDLITNMSLRSLVNSHVECRQWSKNNILTMALGLGRASECYFLDRASQEILQIHDYNKEFVLNTERVRIDKNTATLEVRGDLVSTKVCICTLDVLKGFKENIEYQSINDFVVAMLTSEIYEQKIHAHILANSEYAARINTASSLYTAYMSLLQRHLSPYEVSCKAKDSQLKYLDYNKYIKSTSVDTRKVRLSHNIYIGENTTVGADSTISKTVIGRDVRVGRNVTLNYCVVLEGTIIEDGANYEYCLLESTQDKQLNVVSFKNQVIPEETKLVSNELFPPTPEPEDNFEDELRILTGEAPTKETYDELSNLRKSFNKQTVEFTAEILQQLSPADMKEVKKTVEEWGPTFRKLCLNVPNDLIEAILEGCRKVEHLKSAFHIFLQFLYNNDVLSEQEIVDWHKANSQNPDKKHFVDLCNKFVEKLIEMMEDEDEEDQQDD